MKRLLLMLSIFVAFSVVVYAAGHPVKIDGKTCDTCHSEGSSDENKADAEAFKQWKMSAHGLNGVNCTVCHSDEANFKAKSSLEVCASCHSEETATIKGKLSCASCHTVHSFLPKTGVKAPHKIIKY